ncbi:hypothetical protein [Kribbella sp. NPDC003557]|uniref:hypothetical protein n=1 Tax=Kribbella sp. NPDC003557 TaxID=3154449 RepID=UPI0033B847EC
MRTNISAARSDDRYVLRFTAAQRSMMKSVGIFVRDRADAVDSVVRFGAESTVASNIIERTQSDNAFTPQEAHILFSVLVGTAVMIQTEEQFYLRLGFFREQAMDLANSLAAALSDAE